MSPRRRILTILALFPLAVAGVYGGGCGGRDPSFEVDRVVYEGQATRAALLELLANKATVSAAQKTAFDAPAPGATLSAGAPSMFRWHVVSALAEASPGRRTPDHAAWMSEIIGPPRAARAHDPPVNGRAYFLVFASGGTNILGVFTTRLDYTPSADDWAILAAAAQPLEVSMLSGVFADSVLAEAGGPFLGDPLGFSIAP